MVHGVITGRNFKFCNYTMSDLDHIVNWLAERGLMATVNDNEFTVEIIGLINGKWKEDVNGDLFRVD